MKEVPLIRCREFNSRLFKQHLECLPSTLCEHEAHPCAVVLDHTLDYHVPCDPAWNADPGRDARNTEKENALVRGELGNE